MRPGDVLTGRYRLIDLLSDARGGRFWRAWDGVLARPVAVHLISREDPRAEVLIDAARRSAQVLDPRLLRVLDAGVTDDWCYVVNEWGEGHSLDILLAEEPLSPRRAAWVVGEVAELLATAHGLGITHGRLVPDNVMIDDRGSVKVVGFAVDAALHGVTPAALGAELVDLVGLLYAALTGKWPGPSSSRVPTAPRDHGRVLRPRQVRAGVPRVLDALCDGVFNPDHALPGQRVRSASEVAMAMFDFIGDRTAVAEAEAARNRGNTSPRIPRIETFALAPGLPADEEPATEQPAADATDDDATQVGAPPVPDLPGEMTQAGVPVFDDEILDPEWRTPSPKPAPPPPPFEDNPERPLFAPDPPEGRPARTPRPDVPEISDSSAFWPWGTEVGKVPIIDEEPEEEEPVPGRGWMRGAWILAVALLVLLAMIYGFNRGLNDGGGGDDDAPTTEPSSQSQATGDPVSPKATFDFDPQGGSDGENASLVALAFDGDSQTRWQTSRYKQNFGPGGLKDGVGLLIDLGRERDLSQVSVEVAGGPTDLELLGFTGSERPTDLSASTVLASAQGADGVARLNPQQPASTRWVAVWLTSLPDPDGFRGQVAEVQIRS
ncbi:protein kinase family protein [Nocardioides dubius]|uniref:Protein kinase domain-containing protein n=1 Tax=Nocardioides dubius TaxID=317019 RepID=A0ABN1U4W3_9ACTN